MKTPRDTFKEVVEEFGFSDAKPSQLTNSDYWLCTITAMERYRTSALQEAAEKISKNINKLKSESQSLERQEDVAGYIEYGKTTAYRNSLLITKNSILSLIPKEQKL